MSLRKVLAAACLGALLSSGAAAALVDWSGRASTDVKNDLREEQVAFERGVEALLRKDYALAEKHFNKSRQLNAEWVEPYLGLADVELARKHGDKARAFKKVLELDPYNWRAQIDLADLPLTHLGKPERAVEAYRSAIKLQ